MNELPSRTAWAQTVRRGAQPTALELRDHLLTVHKANAGFTESCARRCRDSLGRNSYEWLADVVDPAVHRSVLDLACGSGPLIEHCFARFGGDMSLTGVDMSADELALARARLGNGSVRFHQGFAQALDVFAPASVDVVLCHWALTLMDPVEPVLTEARRLLRDGGVFAAIVDGDTQADPSYSAVNDVVYRWVQREFPRYGEVELGDPRVRRAGDLADLARRAFGTDAVAIDAGVFVLEGESEAIAREAAGFFYSSFVLSPEAHAAMLEELSTLLCGADGSGRFSMPVNRLVVRLPA
jgi:SAM-dependent methyltransferase